MKSRERDEHDKLSLEILVATMNLTNIDSLVASLNISGSTLMINQVTESLMSTPKTYAIGNGAIRVLNFNESGLSKSRNRALNAAVGDICILADDDVKFVDKYEEIVLGAFIDNPDTDIIAFKVNNQEGMPISSLRENQTIHFPKFMKLSSVQIAFRRSSLVASRVQFREDFGAGAEKYMGEENIFLADCLRKGLKIMYVDKLLCELLPSESTWFQGFDTKYFKVRGAVLYRISPVLSPALIMQFAIRKYSLYKDRVGFFKALMHMAIGAYNEWREPQKVT